jgi:hydrophobic/amphiphilic exporter-1 (mainly G- bacteria), HAE1 family
MNRLLGGGDSRIALEIRGDDLVEASRLAEAAKEVMDRTPEVRNAQVGREEGRPEVAVEIDRPKAALLGLTVANIASTIRTSVGGTRRPTSAQDGKEYPIVVRLREEDRERSEDIGGRACEHAAGPGRGSPQPRDAR